jgi:hypothetical protein
LIAGVAVTFVAIVTTASGAFLLGTTVAGVGFGVAFMGAVQRVTAAAPAPCRPSRPGGALTLGRAKQSYRSKETQMSHETLADQLVEVLREAGVEHIYGVVGDS